ncbi:hypothetical protein C882_0709 [Caenispirillum salinarum AK4]|uniref:Uncharacterized protein n=1 Tax=Caenispirillum salinarum AK4 TaxID=1238182 RepID=K9GSH3_9PROT|nr:hypothetical protein C882_0709 [Caenispirillum salinarum AK4]
MSNLPWFERPRGSSFFGPAAGFAYAVPVPDGATILQTLQCVYPAARTVQDRPLRWMCVIFPPVREMPASRAGERRKRRRVMREAD